MPLFDKKEVLREGTCGVCFASMSMATTIGIRPMKPIFSMKQNTSNRQKKLKSPTVMVDYALFSERKIQTKNTAEGGY